MDRYEMDRWMNELSIHIIELEGSIDDLTLFIELNWQ